MHRRPFSIVLPILTLALALAAARLGTLPCSALAKPVVVSACQSPCQDGDFTANLTVARDQIRLARERGSHFLAFPECFLSGYESRETVQRGARALEDPELAAFIAESAAHDLVVIAGLARRAGTQLFNSALVIHRGRLVGVYDKVMLTPGDRHDLGFSPGTQVPVFQAHGTRFAVLLCADTSYPHVAMAARLQGAEILFTPHYNQIAAPVADDHRRWVRHCHVGLACHLQVAVVRANVIQSDRPDQLGYGDSFILSPQGEPLAEARLFAPALLTATLDPALFKPPGVWADLQDPPAWLRQQLADLLLQDRRPSSDSELREWLENMAVHHRYSTPEMAAATGLTSFEIDQALGRFQLAGKNPGPRAAGDPLRVLPYPGGRHPRLGFFDGAVAPQRETKVSVFTPWQADAYVVVDVPEAIFSNLGLTYLAHMHIPTVWDLQGIRLPRTEWQRLPDGRLRTERTLPNGITFTSEVRPGSDGIRFQLQLRNGTGATLTGLRVQNCVMLGAAPGFTEQTLTNKVFAPPFAAARSVDGHRWVITAWERCGRAWGNEWVPCIHADPVFPDCPAGQTVRLQGWLSFFEGPDIHAEFRRLASARALEASGDHP